MLVFWYFVLENTGGTPENGGFDLMKHSIPKVGLMKNYTFSHCESASVHLRSADCIGVVSWDTTPAKVASYRHSAPL